MNGIYIHIPYCRKVCNYCDFHFSVSLKNKKELVQAIIKEIDLRRNFFEKAEANSEQVHPELENHILGAHHHKQPKHIHTIYFGGGTPSVLEISELELILNHIRNTFELVHKPEITLEANPDDLKWEYVCGLRKLGFNRLSVGIQSFNDEHLQWMNRRHNGSEASESIRICHEAGFDNINADLIYGLPGLNVKQWQHNLETFFTLNIPHLSAYHLTIEPKTVLGYHKRKGRVTEISDIDSHLQYSILTDTMQGFGYQHYEISNFCIDGHYSLHNTNYWKQGNYLGLGPSAHSYDGATRSWNISVNSDYIAAVDKGEGYNELEVLSNNDRFNDFLLTRLRTCWGFELGTIKHKFGDIYSRHLQKELEKMNGSSDIILMNNKIRLSESGMFVSDRIISQLFFVE